MELVGIGTDIVECLRIGRMIEQHGEQFLSRVYTDREVRWCRSRKRSLELFAGCWAAKQAVLRCLGTTWRKGLSWQDIEIRTDDGARPRVVLRGMVRELAQQQNVGGILLSISQCRAYATAYATAVRSETSAELHEPEA